MRSTGSSDFATATAFLRPSHFADSASLGLEQSSCRLAVAPARIMLTAIDDKRVNEKQLVRVRPNLEEQFLVRAIATAD